MHQHFKFFFVNIGLMMAYLGRNYKPVIEIIKQKHCCDRRSSYQFHFNILLQTQLDVLHHEVFR